MDTRVRVNPFPGLRSYTPDEADLFFGRDGQTDELVRRLANTRFLAVVGASGSGKSSLVKAGLLPSLEAGFMAGAGAHWRMGIMRPQNDPIGFLARALVESGMLGQFGFTAAAAEGVAETALRRSSLGLAELARLARLEPHENLLIVVDQFEELFRFADLGPETGSREDATSFVKLLLTATEQCEVPIYVVITMRSDFIGDCTRFRDLPEAVSNSQYLIPRFTRDELQQVITGPIGVQGARIAPMLVQRLLNEMGDEMDQLPLLQHALMRTWDHWNESAPDGREIDAQDLDAVGGMAGALSRHVDEAYESLPSERERLIAQKLFKALSEKGSDNREIRRPTPLSRLAEIAGATLADLTRIIDVFRAPGRCFLMPPAGVELQPDSVIDISHESLIRQWVSLRTWVEEESASRTIFLRIVQAADLHQQGNTGPWREPDLTYARRWLEREKPTPAWAQQYGGGFDAALEFLQKSERVYAAELEEERSAKERELEQAKALAAEQRQRADEQASARRKLRWLTIGLALSLVLAIAGALMAVAGRERALAIAADNEQLRKFAEDKAFEARAQKALAQESALRAEAQAAMLAKVIAAEPDPRRRETLIREYLPESNKQLSPEQRETKRAVETTRKGDSSRASARSDQSGLKLWANGSTLRVRFLDGEPALQQRVLRTAQEWSKYANIQFESGSNPDAEVRVSFKQPGVWSFIGTDALGVPRDQPTVNFGWLTLKTDPEEFRRAVLHEFGHVLGLIHEFQNPNADIPWDVEQIYKELSGPPNNWSREAIQANFFSRPKGIQYREYDPKSIMMLGTFPPSYFTRPFEIREHTVLSESDKAFIRKLYPPS